jgi:hypothetical protein
VRVRTRRWKVGRKASAWEAQVRRPRQAAAARRRERTSRRERMVATTAGGSAASIAGGVGHGSIGSGGDMVVVVDGIAGRQADCCDGVGGEEMRGVVGRWERER